MKGQWVRAVAYLVAGPGTYFGDLAQGDLAAKGGWQIAERVDLHNGRKLKTASQRLRIKIAFGLKVMRGLTSI